MSRVLLAVFAIASAALLAACGEDDPRPDATPTSVASSPAPGASATPPSGAIELTVGEPIDFPEDLAIVIATGCWQCDGPTESLVRLRRTPTGIEQRTVITRPPNGSITGYAFDGAAGKAAVSTCMPNCSGLGEITGTEQTIIHLSTDGGASFAASPVIDGWFWVEGYSTGSLLVTGPCCGDESTVRLYPDMTAVARPSPDSNAFPTASEVLWVVPDPSSRRNTKLLAHNLTTVLFDAADDSIVNVTALDHAGEQLALLLFRQEDAEDGGSGYRLHIGKLNTGSTLTIERTVTGGFIWAGALLDRCILVANAELPQGTFPTPEAQGAFAGFLPSLIDTCDGVIHPIVDPFTGAPYLNGRNLITAVQRGPFRAVRDDVGDCLNVRESPSTTAQTLGCFGAGVLLRDLGELSDEGGQGSVDRETWRHVVTPAGDEGWASDAFLAP